MQPFTSRFTGLALGMFLFTLTAIAQKTTFTHQDSLRGTITAERAWWDLTYYELNVDVNVQARHIMGTNVVQYRVLESSTLPLQIDLQPPMKLTRAEQNGEPLKITRDGNAYYIWPNHAQQANAVKEITLHFGGLPRQSMNPPWSGGFTWKTDANGKPFIATSCQGDGASLWWPCKDHAYDEPDSMRINITVPDSLTAVSNGRLRTTSQNANKTQTFSWFVSNPINNYGVNVNIADYVHFGETYDGKKGKLDCDYYVLPYNLEKAKKQFKDVKRMLDAFEYWFGPYPFYEDSYKLVEVPYVGMEHQSSVTYGNGYQNGYMKKDISYTGWGKKFDFIIIHESGHEWFANNITAVDIADMWIHESFTAYSEGLFVEYHYGKEAGAEYIRGSRKNILNDRPVQGVFNVNYHGSDDMYYKGSNMLHTLRQWINNDSLWRSILTGMNRDFYHQTVTGQQVEDYLELKTGLELTTFFDQYLRDTRIPVLKYVIENNTLKYRWDDCVPGFVMPVQVYMNSKAVLLHPTTQWQEMEVGPTVTALTLNPDFYVNIARGISNK